MYNHEKENYICPFCLLVNGIENDKVYSRQSDIVYKDEFVTAFIASHQLIKNPGTVLIIPNKHVENLYDLHDDLSAKIHQLERKIAVAMRSAYPCQGNVIRQHNEPIEGAKCKGQDVLHYHLQIIPRYSSDKMYEYAEDGQRELASQEERKNYAELLKDVL